MARRKEYYLIIDTETANTLEQPLPYDIGYAICDRHGNIVEQRSYMVAELFCDNKPLLQSAYYSEKLPMYWDRLKNGECEMKSIFNIRKQIIADMKKYKVKKVGAYNMAFDKRALNTIIRYCSKSLIRWFFPFGTEYFCVWNMACQTIMNTNKYIEFALKNDFISNADNILTNAECCYRYVMEKPTFEEEHTGLADVLIEVEIFAHCIATHKKMDKSICPSCWRIPQKKRKEMKKNREI